MFFLPYDRVSVISHTFTNDVHYLSYTGILFKTLLPHTLCSKILHKIDFWNDNEHIQAGTHFTHLR